MAPLHILCFLGCETDTRINPYPQETQPRWRLTETWLRKVHELFLPWTQTDTDGWLTDETQRDIWKTERQRPQTGTHPLLLWLPPPPPLHLTPAAPPLQPDSPSPLSPYVYESVTMATSPQGQRRRGLPSFRQISIAGLIYDGLFRDYNTLMRGQNVCTCTHVWT